MAHLKNLRDPKDLKDPREDFLVLDVVDVLEVLYLPFGVRSRGATPAHWVQLPASSVFIASACMSSIHSRVRTES